MANKYNIIPRLLADLGFLLGFPKYKICTFFFEEQNFRNSIAKEKKLQKKQRKRTKTKNKQKNIAMSVVTEIISAWFWYKNSYLFFCYSATIFPRSLPNFQQSTKVSVERLSGRSIQRDIMVKILIVKQNLGKTKGEQSFISTTTRES